MSVTVYHSFEDAVEADYDPELDGDDGTPVDQRTSLVARIPPPPEFVMQRRGLLVPKQSVVVPFVKGVNEGDKSDAVYAVKRAWARREGKGRLRALEGKPPAVKRTWQKTFSQEFGAKSYTRARHDKLAFWYDAKCLSLVRSATKTTARDTQIAVMLGWLNAVYNRRWAVRYDQARPSQLVSPTRLTRGDCSGSVAGACAWAKIMPGRDWRYTNTWSQVELGTEITGGIRNALPGDTIYYGSPSHVAVYLGNGIVWSFGSFPAKILPYNYRHDRREIRRFLRVA